MCASDNDRLARDNRSAARSHCRERQRSRFMTRSCSRVAAVPVPPKHRPAVPKRASGNFSDAYLAYRSGSNSCLRSMDVIDRGRTSRSRRDKDKGDCETQGKRVAGLPILISPRQGLPSSSVSEGRPLAHAVIRLKISFRPGHRQAQSFALPAHLSVVCVY